MTYKEYSAIQPKVKELFQNIDFKDEHINTFFFITKTRLTNDKTLKEMIEENY